MGEFAVLILAPEVEFADRLVGVRVFTLHLRHFHILALLPACVGLNSVRILCLVSMAVVLVVTTTAPEVISSAGSVEQRSPVPMSVVGVCHGALLHEELLLHLLQHLVLLLHHCEDVWRNILSGHVGGHAVHSAHAVHSWTHGHAIHVH
jgi:hypothetical protein